MDKTTLMKTALPLLTLLTAALLFGCASQPSVPPADRNSPEAAGKPVVLLDEDMDHYVAVDTVRAGKNENGYLVVQTNIRSRTEKDLTIQAQTLFYDGNGNVLNSDAGNEAPWMTLPLTANSTVPYRVQALNPAAEKFTVRLRYLGRKTY